MTEPMSDERLAEIRERAGWVKAHHERTTIETAAYKDVPDLLAEVERLTAGVRALYLRCIQGARDNGEYYERVPEAKYELGKATVWDGCAEMLRELVPDVSGAETSRG